MFFHRPLDRLLILRATDSSFYYPLKIYKNLIFFVGVLTYASIMIASTTDRDLLIPDSTVKLPILGTEVKLSLFYGAAPVIIL